MAGSKRPRSRASRDQARPKEARPLGAVALCLSLATAGALLAVDTRALAAFDAPKRLVAILGIMAALVAAAFDTRVPDIPPTLLRRASLFASAAALVLVVLSMMASPRRPIAIDTARTMAVFALVAILAAMDERVWTGITRAFVFGAACNAVLSLLQIAGSVGIFQYRTIGGRANTSALIGNDGMLSLTMALAAILVAGWLSTKELTSRRRGAAIVLLMLLIAAMVANRSITAIAAFVAGVAALWLLSRAGNGARLVTAMTIMIVLTGLLTSAAAQWPRWNKALTYRLGAWGAAAEMALERPLLGFGPGTYASEFVTHRIRADLRAGERLANPFLAGSYAEAHSEYLQALAETGLPATLLICASLIACTALAAASVQEDSRVVAALLVSGAVAALTWFPLQHPAMALLLLAALGRAWRSA